MISGTHRRFVTPKLRLAVVVLVFASALGAASFPALRQAVAQKDQAANAQEMSATALNQIGALVSEKLSRTPRQRKIDSQILATIHMRRGESVAQGIAQLQTDVEITAGDRARVDIRAKVTRELLDEIAKAGGEIINSVPRFDAIRALVPLEQIEALASLPDVQFIGRAVKAQTRAAWKRDGFPGLPGRTSPIDHPLISFAERAERVRWQLPGLLSNLSARRLKGRTLQGAHNHRGLRRRQDPPSY